MSIADSLIVIGMSVASLGTIHEADGPRSHTFWLLNQCRDTVELVQGYTSCGCTTIHFSQHALIAPGDSSQVALRFNPLGKGGEFYESGTVVYRRESDSAASSCQRVEIALHGTCIPSEETLLRQFPIVINDSLRVSTNRFDVGRMTVGDSRERSIVVLHRRDNRQERIPLTVTVNGDMACGLQHIERHVTVGDTTFTVTFDVLIY